MSLEKRSVPPWRISNGLVWTNPDLEKLAIHFWNCLVFLYRIVIITKSHAVNYIVSSQIVVIRKFQLNDNFGLKAFFEELDIPEPDINLGIGSGTHAEKVAEKWV